MDARIAMEALRTIPRLRRDGVQPGRAADAATTRVLAR
jgi:hypothetical protein